MCPKCQALYNEIYRCRAGHKDRKDYFRRYYRKHRERKLRAANERYRRVRALSANATTV